MIREKTVFVIGAGASFELGLPLGVELKSQIAKKLNIKYRNGAVLTSGDQNICDAIKFVKSPNEDFNSYRLAAVSAAEAMPLAPSIDNFVHAHREDKLVEKVAKLGIAACILEGERKSKLFDDHSKNQRFSLDGVSDTWLLRLHHMLTEDVAKKDAEHCMKSVSFIIFNYDRCVEQFLARSLSVYFRIPDEQSQRIVSKGRFYHPYGQVGLLPWQSGEGIPFGFNHDGRALAKAASSIQTFTEGVSDEAMTRAIKHEVQTSAAVVFLGFAYHKMNLTLLRQDTKSSLKKLYGSAIGISDANLTEIHNELAKNFVQIEGYSEYDYIKDYMYLHQNLTCSTLLDHYYRVLTR